MKIYFAAPLFSNAERRFNLELSKQIEQLGFDVFLPQRDGVEKNKIPYSKMTQEERRKALFELDRDQIFNCDIFLFILDGRVPDEGAAVELGMAYTHNHLNDHKKMILGLHTDTRAAFTGSKLNPMLSMALDRLFTSDESLIGFLASLK